MRSSLLALIHERSAGLTRPFIVAIDGRSGTGKSTLARELATLLDALVIDGDDFFAGGIDVRTDAPADRVRDCIDWRRQRPVLEALRSGHEATYYAFDWDAFDGRLQSEPARCEPRPIVILEGVYSGRYELADLIDVRVLLRVSEETRMARLLAREGSIGPWEIQWHEAEEWYFTQAAPPETFDLVVDG